MSEELSDDDGVMLLNKLQVAFVEMGSKPRLTAFLLKKARWHMTNYVNLEEDQRLRNTCKTSLKVTGYVFQTNIHGAICQVYQQ